MSVQHVSRVLKAAADPTRLRLLSALAAGEATVGELQEILEQSQPRVSRHLKLLDEAGLVDKFRDGQSIYYRLQQNASTDELVRLITHIAGEPDATLARDRHALLQVKRGRQRDALAEARQGPMLNATSFAARPEPADLRDALDDALDTGNGSSLLDNALDVGCGGGTLLAELARRARNVVGIDTLKGMRLVARSQLHQAGLNNCTVRDADMYDLPFEDHEFDLVVLDEVLSLSDKPEQVIFEAARVLQRGARLLILDRIVPVVSRLTAAASGGALFENQLATLLSARGLRITQRTWFPGRAMDFALFTAT